MSVILTHIGQTLPYYLDLTLLQLRKFYEGKIFLITNCEASEFQIKYEIEVFGPELNSDEYKEIEQIKFNEYPSKEFWYYSLLRFFLIEKTLADKNVEDFVILENDILIFDKLKPLIEKLAKLKRKIFFTIGDEIRATTGFTFFKSLDSLKELNQLLLEIIRDPSKMRDINDNYSACCPSEMVFIRKISKENDLIQSLPLFSSDSFFEELGYVFDPASYGQYLAGTSPESGNHKTYIDEITYIGKKILNNELSVHYSPEDGPYIIENNTTKCKIFNLHIHSKNLSKFV